MEKPLKDYIVIYDYNDDYSSYGKVLKRMLCQKQAENILGINQLHYINLVYMMQKFIHVLGQIMLMDVVTGMMKDRRLINEYTF